jgi:hypothetical protein
MRQRVGDGHGMKLTVALGQVTIKENQRLVLRLAKASGRTLHHSC